HIMFESAVIDNRPGRGVASFSGSLLIQTGLVGSLLCIGLLIPVAQPDLPELHIAPPAPRFKDAIKIISTAMMPSTAPAMMRQRFVFRPITSQTQLPASSAPSMETIFSDAPSIGIAGARDGIVGAVPALGE